MFGSEDLERSTRRRGLIAARRSLTSAIMLRNQLRFRSGLSYEWDLAVLFLSPTVVQNKFSSELSSTRVPQTPWYQSDTNTTITNSGVILQICGRTPSLCDGAQNILVIDNRCTIREVADNFVETAARRTPQSLEWAAVLNLLPL